MVPPDDPEATAALPGVTMATHGFDSANVRVQDRDRPPPNLFTGAEAVSETTRQPKGTEEQGDILDLTVHGNMNPVRAQILAIEEQEDLTHTTRIVS